MLYINLNSIFVSTKTSIMIHIINTYGRLLSEFIIRRNKMLVLRISEVLRGEEYGIK